jgi:hypothetical protein
MESLRPSLRHDCLKALELTVHSPVPIGQTRWCYAMLQLLAWDQCFPGDVETFIIGSSHPGPDLRRFQMLARMHTWSFACPNVLHKFDGVEWSKVRPRSLVDCADLWATPAAGLCALFIAAEHF